MNGLVSDIRRHLDNEPVSAAAPTFQYQLQKFYKKNTRQLQLGLTVAFLLLLAMVISIASIMRATNEKNRADQESIRGDTVAKFASGLIEKATPNWREGNLSQLRALLKDAESVALTTLQNAPAAEFQLLYQLLKPYDHIVRSHPDAFRVAQRLSELALTLDDSNMGGVTRLEIECLMATLTLWRSKVNDPDLEGNIQALRDLAMRAQSSGSGKSLEASWCRTALASYLSVLDRDEEALKIIKLGMDTRQVVARFEAERQALAMMDHPNIAKVLDAGTTDHGRPFFVMELVQGVPITEFCDKNKLSAQDRLELFIPVCQSILSAHQKGIIHRDIKPSNVLVTLHHGIPMAKVIDFGIAKAINQKLTEKTLFTHYATMIGTPAYMSPEQAEMSSMDVDTRTDVYSLGVLLYELLTGTTPFPEKRLRSMGYGEMQKVIAEEEPMKPSTCLSTMQNEERKTVSQCRGLDINTLSGQLKGDLDWIVMKCLEKDRRRRYDTPKELVEDLQRHLNNEPVSAAAPSFTYQLQKFYRRNRAQMRVLAGTTVLLVLATIFSGVMAIVANKEKEKALVLQKKTEEAMEQAESESIRGDTIAQSLIGFLDETIPAIRDNGNSSSAISFLDQADLMAENLESVPVSEFALRYAILKYHRYVTYQFAKAIKQWDRLMALIGQFSDADLPAPRFEIECDILSCRLIETEVDHPEFEDVVQKIMVLADRAEKEPERAGDAAARCHATLSNLFYHSDLNQRAIPELMELPSMLARFPNSSVGPYAQFTYYCLLQKGELPKTFQPPWSEPTVLPRHDWQFAARYHNMLSVKFRYLLEEKPSDEIYRFLDETFEKFKEAKWIDSDATFEPHLVLMRVELLIRAKQWEEAGSLLRKLFDGVEGDFYARMNAIEEAARLPNLELYEDMRLTMLSLYLNHLHPLHANRLSRAAVIHPGASSVVTMVERSLDNSTGNMFSERNRIDQHLTRALFAYRLKKYPSALNQLDTLAKEQSNSPIAVRLLKRRDREWDWRMLRAMTLLELGRKKDALAAYREGLEVRNQNQMEDQALNQDILLNQAQVALRERNLIR